MGLILLENLICAAHHASKRVFAVKCLLRLRHACVLVGVIYITRLKFSTFFFYFKNAKCLLSSASSKSHASELLPE